VSLMTDDYREEIIEAAQLAGVKSTKDSFFPRWRVNKFFSAGRIKVECTGDKQYRVTVTDPASQRSASVFVSAPNSHKS